MAYDPSIILAGQPVNVLGAMQAGNLAADQTNALVAKRQLADLYRTQGAGIMAGDPGALNALAGIDPTAALGIQGSQLGMAATRQDMAAQDQAMQAQRDAIKKAAAAEAAKMTADQLAQEQAKLESALAGAAYFHQNGDKAGYDAFLQSHGVDPMQHPFERFPADAAMFKDVLDVWKGFAPPKPEKDPTPAGIQELKYRAEQAGLKEGTPEFQAFMLNGGPPKAGTSLVMGSDGTVTFSQGGSADGGLTSGDLLSADATAPQTMLDAIDAIKSDPALNKVVGPIEGGGGNNVDELGMAQRAYYGGDGLALIQKIAQLQNTTWLAARKMLKGGGAITDYESKKAEGAMGRLSRATSEEQFKAALADLRSAIADGQAKLQAAGTTTATAPAAGSNLPQPATPPQQGTSQPGAPADIQLLLDKYK